VTVMDVNSPSLSRNDSHLDSLLSNLEGAITDLNGLETRIQSAELIAELQKVATHIRGRIKIATTYAYCPDPDSLAAEARLIPGVRVAHKAGDHMVTFTATSDAIRKLAFLYPEAKFETEGHEDGEGQFVEPKSRPSVKNLEKIKDGDHATEDDEDPKSLMPKEAAAKLAAMKIASHFDNVPGVYGINVENGTVVVSCDKRFPRSARISIVVEASPAKVEFKTS
jgi:hypothetical protein